MKAELGPPLNLFDKITSSYPSMSLAAEFKRASPSKGLINGDVDAGEQAVLYADAGASVISVLTEPTWFLGSLSDLSSARRKTQTWASTLGQERPAVLRKDFITDEYQILEGLAAGCDTVLLIVAVTPKDRLRKLIDFSREVRNLGKGRANGDRENRNSRWSEVATNKWTSGQVDKEQH